MENYADNSHSAKAPSDDNRRPEPDKIESIVKGKVVLRKKPLSSRFKDLFTGDDGRSVMGYLIEEVLAPALKDVVADTVNQGIEKILYGDDRLGNRRSSSRGSSNNYVPYNRYSSNNSNNSRRDEPRQQARRSRMPEFEEVVMSSRAEAMQVLDKMHDRLQRYDSVSVVDLYDLVGMNSHYTLEKYGWTSLTGGRVTHVKGGYLIDLPQPEPLD